MKTGLIFLVLAVLVLSVPVLLIAALLSVSGLKRRLSQVERQLAELQAHWPPGQLSPEAVTEPLPQTEGAPLPSGVGAAAIAETDDGPPAVFAREAVTARQAVPPPLSDVAPPAAATPIPTPPPLRPAPQAAVAVPGVMEKILGGIKDWFTRGNLPVKVGMLVMLAGVVALLRYAGQQGWVQLPIELRLAGVAAVASAAVVFGWRQRARRPQFALALQGGAIGALLLTIFAASKMYGVLPLELAFALSVALIAAAGVLAVLQDSRTLAILATLAGFCAPLWLSSGSGNHVVLFTYYAILNLAIFGVVWLKPWRVLMLLGFVFTWGIGILWAVLSYRPELYASAQTFLVLFFLIYLLMPVLHARRQLPVRGDVINGLLLFATPLLAFSLQAGLMSAERMSLAFVAVAVAAIYALLGAWLRGHARYRVLFDAYVLLATGFVTLAIPLAFSARVSGALLAVEGALLVWFGLRQQRALPLYAGLGLQLVAALLHWGARSDASLRGMQYGDGLNAAMAWPVLNALAMGGLILAVAGFSSALLLWRRQRVLLAVLLYGWGLYHWLGTWAAEIAWFADGAVARLAWQLLLASSTAWLAAEAFRRWQGRALALTVPLALLMVLLLNLSAFTLDIRVLGLTGLAWLVHGVLGWRSLQALRGSALPEAGGSQLLWWLSWPLLLSLGLSSLGSGRNLDNGWIFALYFLPWLAALAVALRAGRVVMQPLGAAFAAWRPRLVAALAVPVVLGFALGFLSLGKAAPLPWIALLNPLELLQLLALLLLVDGQRRYRLGRWAQISLGVLALLWVSQMVLRSTHHWGGLPWGVQMLHFSLAQTSLTVLWSVLGMAAWVAGSRRSHRGLWLMGALLMGLVLLKLLLIDRQHLGNLLGIGSFIVYGLLCTVVGYLAPAPPREQKENAA
ncbi:MAG: DUF2339 domain-containing protein [Pseudomonadota bacterium]|nr:DUF2339 domain-containing protein [Pseudomonadota bacterium]